MTISELMKRCQKTSHISQFESRNLKAVMEDIMTYFKSNFSGLLTIAQTTWPLAKACCTTRRPIGPDAPKTANLGNSNSTAMAINDSVLWRMYTSCKNNPCMLSKSNMATAELLFPKLAVLSATGRTGLPLVQKALAKGQSVAAVVRNREKFQLE